MIPIFPPMKLGTKIRKYNTNKTGQAVGRLFSNHGGETTALLINFGEHINGIPVIEAHPITQPKG